MAIFTEPSEMRSRTTIPELINTTDDQLDDLWLIPAERHIEARYNLTLDTSNEPINWSGLFASRPAEKTKFENDYRRSVFILVNYWASNPHNFAQQSVAGSSVVYKDVFPPRVDALMDKWSSPPEIFRV